MTDTLPPQGLKITAADIQGPETGAPDAKKIAAEIYLALREQSPSACVSGDPRDGEDCVIDGVFKLCAVGNLLIDRLHLGGASAAKKAE
jgi:hypothetical protein